MPTPFPLTPPASFPHQCEMMRGGDRPDVNCDTPEDAYPRDTYFVGEGVPPPPPGWRREVIPRKTVSGADAYYYSPCGKRMRSKPDVQRFLDKCREEGKYTDVSIESFDFSTQAKAIKPPGCQASEEGRRRRGRQGQIRGQGGGEGRGEGPRTREGEGERRGGAGGGEERRG